jgi:hypothetical protein
MQFSLTNAVDALAISLLLYLLVVLSNRRRRRGGLPLPPGPPTWPIIGNLLDVPKKAPWIAYSEMSKKYGRHLILGNWLALAETRVPRRCYLSPHFLSGRRRLVFGISRKGST